jgi:hypothetical protein
MELVLVSPERAATFPFKIARLTAGREVLGQAREARNVPADQ